MASGSLTLSVLSPYDKVNLQVMSLSGWSDSFEAIAVSLFLSYPYSYFPHLVPQYDLYSFLIE